MSFFSLIMLRWASSQTPRCGEQEKTAWSKQFDSLLFPSNAISWTHKNKTQTLVIQFLTLTQFTRVMSCTVQLPCTSVPVSNKCTLVCINRFPSPLRCVSFLSLSLANGVWRWSADEFKGILCLYLLDQYDSLFAQLNLPCGSGSGSGVRRLFCAYGMHYGAIWQRESCTPPLVILFEMVPPVSVKAAGTYFSKACCLSLWGRI